MLSIEETTYFQKDNKFYRIRPTRSYLVEMFNKKDWFSPFDMSSLEIAEKRLSSVMGCLDLSDFESSELEALMYEKAKLEEVKQNMTEDIQNKIDTIDARIEELMEQESYE